MKAVPWVLPPAVSAAQRLAFSFLCTRQKQSEPKMVVVWYSIFLTNLLKVLKKILHFLLQGGLLK